MLRLFHACLITESTKPQVDRSIWDINADKFEKFLQALVPMEPPVGFFKLAVPEMEKDPDRFVAAVERKRELSFDAPVPLCLGS
ncbi:hypothetical protein AK812_SmicGene1617 [Symbiodinium microadriaticum]|uniref:Uncharacterized protein n=1 Tax=Symbiodinium microadriaticum TaxID=2951 RepID=A0A1Q9F3P3_SYMMI|nr:hypothetical protein AK812_SmicGene1617 [Symbiodinium microadriaticum]